MSTPREERELRESARLMVQAGLTPEAAQEVSLSAMVADLMPETDPVILAKAWLHAARRDLAGRASGWTAPTDHDRFRAAMTECVRHGLLVLAGVDTLDEVRQRVIAEEREIRGVLWFSERAVWHAIDHGVLEAGLRHGTGHQVEPGDPLVTAVLDCLQRHGVAARTEQGSLRVECAWRRRP